jgi:protein-disulfide isomerase
MVRDEYGLPSNYTVNIGRPGPSNFNGYEELPVIISNSANTQTLNFLLSKTGAQLIRMEKFNLLRDPVFNIGIVGRPVRGNPSAKVTVVNFDDLECPFCARLYQELFPSTFERYKNQVRFVYEDYPLPQHPWAMHAAIDANCLAVQNGTAYWNYVDYLHRHVNEIGAEAHNLKKSLTELDGIARNEGEAWRVNEPNLDACLRKQDESPVRTSMTEATALGVNRVPALYVNGERIDGAIPEDQIWAVFDRAIRAVGEVPPKPIAHDSSNSQQKTGVSSVGP